MRQLLKTTIRFAFLVAALAVFGANAYAQVGVCRIDLESPVPTTATSYTLAPADGCKMLVFTASGAVAVTLPDPAAALSKGFKVYIKSQGSGGVTLNTPANAKLLDGTNGPLSVTQGKGVDLRSDGVNYYSMGIGVAHP